KESVRRGTCKAAVKPPGGPCGHPTYPGARIPSFTGGFANHLFTVPCGFCVGHSTADRNCCNGDVNKRFNTRSIEIPAKVTLACLASTCLLSTPGHARHLFHASANREDVWGRAGEGPRVDRIRATDCDQRRDEGLRQTAL